MEVNGTSALRPQQQKDTRDIERSEVRQTERDIRDVAAGKKNWCISAMQKMANKVGKAEKLLMTLRRCVKKWLMRR